MMIDAMRAAGEHEGDLAELCPGRDDIPPAVLGQLLIEALPDLEPGRMSATDKMYWVQVAEWLGPDWLESLRRTVAFAVKSDQF